MSARDLLGDLRVVPVVVIEDPASAVTLAETLVACGLPAIEVTLRTPRAIEAMAAIAENVPGMLVGAGSLRDTAQIDAVLHAGARFGVSPGSTPTLIDAAEAAGLPFIPGAATPSESLSLLERGYTLQKLFPAEIVGGARYVAALGAPIPEVSFMPTGGVTPDNAADYLALNNVACVGGTWVAPAGLVSDGKFDDIEALARAAAAL